jgi:hypothetical protein
VCSWRSAVRSASAAASTAAWIGQQHSSSDRDDLALARRLHRLPFLAGQVQAGRLPIRTAGKVAVALDTLRRHVDRPDDLIDGLPAEPTIHAVVIDGVLSQICQADGGLDDTDPRVRQWYQQLSEIAGRPGGDLARLDAAFTLLAQHVEYAQLGPALALLVDAVLPMQLEDAAAQGHANRAGSITLNPDGSGYHVSEGELDATISLPALHAEPGSLPAVSTVTGQPLPLSLIRRWWCDSAVTRFVLGLGHKVIETSHTERTLKAHERRAKHIETGGRCQVAGCRCCPGTPLRPHHPEPWHRTGISSFSDAVLLCDPNHDDLHAGGKTLLLKDGRWLGPDGWAVGPAPPRRRPR